MVSILPQKTNLGSQVGQSLGSGLSQGMQQGLQRGMLQQALGKIGQIGQRGGTPLQALTALMEAGAGIPGSERYIGALAPMLLGQMRSDQLYGPGGYGAAERGGGAPMPPAAAAAEAEKLTLGQEPGGYLSAPMTPDQMRQYAERYALTVGDPQAFTQGMADAERINASRMRSRQDIEQFGESLGVEPRNMPRFMQMATDLQHMPPDVLKRTLENRQRRITNLKDSLKNFVVPGIGTRLFEEGPPKARGKYLKRMDETVANLIKEGEEPFVRESLATMGLSPTEVEERIHPLTSEKEKAMSALPKGKQMNPQGRHDALVNFFEKNVDTNTSLSVLRQHLVENLNYDWREVAQAISDAFPGGDRLNQWQNAEMSNINAPPKQSLESIFGPAADWRNWLRGAK